MNSKDVIKELNELIHDSPVRIPVEFMTGLKNALQCIEDMEERIAIMEEGCHIDIIRELLAKYGEAESAKIWEYSGDIDGDQAELDAELAEYRRRAGIEPRKEGEQYETTDT